MHGPQRQSVPPPFATMVGSPCLWPSPPACTSRAMRPDRVYINKREQKNNGVSVKAPKKARGRRGEYTSLVTSSLFSGGGLFLFERRRRKEESVFFFFASPSLAITPSRPSPETFGERVLAHIMCTHHPLVPNSLVRLYKGYNERLARMRDVRILVQNRPEVE